MRMILHLNGFNIINKSNIFSYGLKINNLTYNNII
jgi:hypothetical protein